MNIFDLDEYETIADIKRKINSLIKKWHPDKCTEKKKEDLYTAKSISLIEAKKIIMDYCENYKISFKQNEIDKYEKPEEFWERRFGKDTHWGNTVKPDK